MENWRESGLVYEQLNIPMAARNKYQDMSPQAALFTISNMVHCGLRPRVGWTAGVSERNLEHCGLDDKNVGSRLAKCPSPLRHRALHVIIGQI